MERVFMAFCGLTINIGHPKLFIRGRAEPMGSSVKDTVNNFVATEFATRLGWPGQFISGYSFEWFSRTGRSGLRTIGRLNDCHLY